MGHIWWMFHLKSALENKGSQTKETELDTYFNSYAEAFKKASSFQNNFIESFVAIG